MSKLQLTTCAMAATLTIGAAAPANCANLTPAEIAALPQDQVEIAKRQCAREWPNDFDMRLWCEDKQFQALQALINRGSIKPKGDKL